MTPETETKRQVGRRPRTAAEYGPAIGAVLFITVVAVALRARLAIIDVAMLFLLGVVFVAARSRRGPAVLASVLSIALFDFLFVPPYYTFTVADTRYFLTFVVMLAVSLTMTHLTGRIREQVEAARISEQRTAALHALDRELRTATSRAAVLTIGRRHLEQAVGGEAMVALADPLLIAAPGPAWPTEGLFESLPVRVAAAWAYQHGESAGCGTHNCADAESLVVPLRTQRHGLGVVAARPDPAGRIIVEDERRTVEVLAGLLAAELDRPEWSGPSFNAVDR